MAVRKLIAGLSQREFDQRIEALEVQLSWLKAAAKGQAQAKRVLVKSYRIEAHDVRAHYRIVVRRR